MLLPAMVILAWCAVAGWLVSEVVRGVVGEQQQSEFVRVAVIGSCAVAFVCPFFSYLLLRCSAGEDTRDNLEWRSGRRHAENSCLHPPCCVVGLGSWLGVPAVLLLLLLSAGHVCLATGASSACGPAGHSGGIAMVAVGWVLFCLYAYFATVTSLLVLADWDD